MARKFFFVCAGMLLLAAVWPGVGHTVALELPPALVTHWRTSNNRLPTDFVARAPNMLFLVDQSAAGEVWTLQHSPLFAFSTVDPITNDRSDLNNVAVAPDGRIFAVDIPPSGVSGRLWRFASNGVRIGSAPLGAVTPIIGNAVALLNFDTLLLGVFRAPGVATFERLQLDGAYIGPWGPSFPTGTAETALDIAVNATGDVFISDGYGHRVLKLDSAGNQLLSWGHYGTGEGEFDMPNAIAVDEFGNVYVADFGNDRVQKFTSDGQFLVQWGGRCNSQPCAELSLGLPKAVACLPGNLVIVGSQGLDSFNSPIGEVKVFQASGAPTSVKNQTWGQLKSHYAPNRGTSKPGTEGR